MHREHAVEDLGRHQVVVRNHELDAHDRRFNPADDEKGERKADVQDAQPLVIDGRHPFVNPIHEGTGDRPVRRVTRLNQSTSDVPISQRSVSRYAATASISRSPSPIAGIRDPGLMASGFRIHCRRFAGVLSATPEAMVSRLIRCVRSGPKVPVGQRSGYGVAIDAGSGLEDVTSLGYGLIRVRRLLLFLNPPIEFSARLNVHAQQHLGVLGSAVPARTAPGRAPSRAGQSMFRSCGSESDPSCPPGEEPRSCDPCRRTAA